MFFALTAISLGLVAGLKPGPLGVFIIHQTLSKSRVDGFLASLAPIITDGPIILLSLFLALTLKEVALFIGIISLFGSAYLIYIAYKILKAPARIQPEAKSKGSESLITAIKINFLNPAPYLFWTSIGSSYILMGSNFEAGIFIVCALLSLCLTKFMVAIAIKELGEHFSPKIYATLLKSLAIPLFLFSGQLFYNGLNILM